MEQNIQFFFGSRLAIAMYRSIICFLDDGRPGDKGELDLDLGAAVGVR